MIILVCEPLHHSAIELAALMQKISNEDIRQTEIYKQEITKLYNPRYEDLIECAYYDQEFIPYTLLPTVKRRLINKSLPACRKLWLINMQIDLKSYRAEHSPPFALTRNFTHL